jgi:hypothetical protein
MLGSGQTERGETGEEQSQENVHHFPKEFVLSGQTINSVYYCDVL